MAAIDEEATGVTDPAALAAELERVEQLLIDAEQRAAVVPELRQRIAELDALLAQARQDAHEARMENQRLDDRLMDSQQVLVDVMNSPSWQITKPLRRAKHLLRDARS